jgi:hypothetical protein
LRPIWCGDGKDGDAADRWCRGADPESRHDPSRQQHGERRAERHRQQPCDVDEHAERNDAPGVTTVGERSEHELAGEAGDEPHADEPADRGVRDAVLVRVVVGDREQHAVAGGEAR